MAIEKRRKEDMHDIPDFTQIDFYVSVYNDVLTDCLWPKVTNVPFKDDEENYPPNTYIEDQMKPGNYEIYDKKTGEIRKATKQECLGMEETAVWDRNHVVDRLMGIDTWTKICE
ncbi:MAG: hypothetical protein HDR38_02795 [Treponema sp.]|nr:hypothetical protein [Treponema sp.]